MSTALDNNRIDQVSGGGFLGLSKRAPCNLSILDPGDRTAVRVSVEERGNRTVDLCSSSSSIGNNSDDDDDVDEDDDEVQSKFKGSNFDSAVDALEKALPIRRGISNFYNGKSKSFASLTDAACSSLKDITKPENAYTRKRKNLLSYTLIHEKGRAPLPRNHGLPKTSMRSSLSSFEENGSSPESYSGSSPESYSGNCSHSPLESTLPPPWRSFSVADLQHCGVNASLPSPSLMGKRNKHDEVS